MVDAADHAVSKPGTPGTKSCSKFGRRLVEDGAAEDRRRPAVPKLHLGHVTPSAWIRSRPPIRSAIAPREAVAEPARGSDEMSHQA